MKKRTIILTTVLVLGAAGGATALLLPRFLVQQATQVPADAGEFITAPPPDEVQLQDRISTAIQQGPPGSGQRDSTPDGPATQPRPDQPQTNTYIPSARAAEQPPAAAGQPNTDAPPAANQPAHAPPQESVPQLEKPPEGDDSDFQVQVSESELAGMIYNGMIRNIQAPYRPAFKGVSTRLQDGRGKITVALAPQHLPEEMLRSLPGVDRNTPVVYMGGEVGLDFDSQTVYPVIHNVSLGNMKIPYAAIKAMIKYEVHRQIASMLQPSSGQQVTLTGVSIANGFLTIKGNVK